MCGRDLYRRCVSGSWALLTLSSCSLHIGVLWLSIMVLMAKKRSLVDEEWEFDLSVGMRLSVYLECWFRKVVVGGFPLRFITSLALAHWLGFQCQACFPSCCVDLKYS